MSSTEAGLSIITVNRNNSKGLEETIESVLVQSVKDFEYIIIDGASTDDSKNVVTCRSEKLNYLKSFRFISEPDAGIFNAMNKGILIAQGKYLLFMNSGDCFFDENVVEKFLTHNYDADIVSGREMYSNVQRLYTPPCSDELTYDFFTRDSLMHQATFIKRELFNPDKIGLYNESYKIVSDWEWFIKALIINNSTYDVTNDIICRYDNEGISCQAKYSKLQQSERQQVFSELLPRVAPMSKELKELREIAKEYRFLKEGKFGFIIRFLLWLKEKKNKH